MNRPTPGMELNRAPTTTSSEVPGNGLDGPSGVCASVTATAACSRTGRRSRCRIGAPLPRERLARRVVRAVDVLVAVDAAAANQPVAARLQRRVVVDGGGM